MYSPRYIAGANLPHYHEGSSLFTSCTNKVPVELRRLCPCCKPNCRFWDQRSIRTMVKGRSRWALHDSGRLFDSLAILACKYRLAAAIFVITLGYTSGIRREHLDNQLLRYPMPHPKAVEATTTSSLGIHVPWLPLVIIPVLAWGLISMRRLTDG